MCQWYQIVLQESHRMPSNQVCSGQLYDLIHLHWILSYLDDYWKEHSFGQLSSFLTGSQACTSEGHFQHIMDSYTPAANTVLKFLAPHGWHAESQNCHSPPNLLHSQLETLWNSFPICHRITSTLWVPPRFTLEMREKERKGVFPFTLLTKWRSEIWNGALQLSAITWSSDTYHMTALNKSDNLLPW